MGEGGGKEKEGNIEKTGKGEKGKGRGAACYRHFPGLFSFPIMTIYPKEGEN